MNKTIGLFLILTILIFASCKPSNSKLSEEGIWKLGWRMIESTLNENINHAEMQFDSLINLSDNVGSDFLVYGLEIKSKLNKDDEVVKILSEQDEEIKSQLCGKAFLAKLSPCLGVSKEVVKNKDLQLELIQMFVDDQASRGVIQEETISKYGLDKANITQDQVSVVDARNRKRLQEIFSEFGFPNKELVGQDAMRGVFIMIQHADRDKAWQKSQMTNIENAVKNGDLQGDRVAYLYDRIKRNNNEKQLYGTQFDLVDPEQNIYQLAPTEDLKNLDQRRREMGIMPIEMYKRFHAKYTGAVVR